MKREARLTFQPEADEAIKGWPGCRRSNAAAHASLARAAPCCARQRRDPREYVGSRSGRRARTCVRRACRYARRSWRSRRAVARWCAAFSRAVFIGNPVTAALLAVFAQQPTRGEDRARRTTRPSPATLTRRPGPARRRAVVGGFHFDTAIEVHAPLAELVVAERLQWQWRQGRLPLRRTSPPTCRNLTVPWIRVSAQCASQRSEIRLGCFEALEALSRALDWRVSKHFDGIEIDVGVMSARVLLPRDLDSHVVKSGREAGNHGLRLPADG